MTLLRSGAYTLAASIVQMICGFAAVTVIARVLGPSSKGAYDLYWTTANLAMMVLGLSLPSGITYAVARGASPIGRLTSQLVVLALLMGAFAALAVGKATSFRPVAHLLPSDPHLLAATGVSAAALFGLALFRAVLVGQRRFVEVSRADIARSGIVLLSVVAAAVYGLRRNTPSAAVMAWANSIGLLAAAVVFLLVISTRLTARIFARSDDLALAAAYALPMYFANLIQFLNYRADVFFVSALRGAAAVGTYQLAVMIAELLRILPGAAQSVIWPTIASQQQIHDTNAALATRVSRVVFLFTLLGAVGVGAAGVVGIPIVFGHAFEASVPALLLLLPGIVAFSLTTVLAGYIAGMGHPRLNLHGSMIGLVATIALDFLLIPKWGITGAALASTFSYSATTLYTVYIYCRLTRVSVARLLVPQRDDLTTGIRIAQGLRGRIRRG